MSFRKAVAGVERRKQRFDFVDVSAFAEHERGKVLVRLTERLDHQRPGAGPGDSDDIDVGREIGEGGEEAFDGHAVLAVKDAPAELRVSELMLEEEDMVAGHSDCHFR